MPRIAAPAVVALLLLPCCQVSEVYGCYAVIVGREASADGSVLVGHNEQNGGRRILNFRRIPPQQFPEGAVVRLRRGGQLPQVPETAALLWSENPGLEFSDAYLNEFGVAVLSDACPTREDDYQTLVARGEIRQGGIGYMLRRLVAQRARSAREGAELAGKLVEQFGYVASGRTYVIADSREAWLVAVVCGRRWVAQRVPDDRVVVLPNIHLIGKVDLKDTDNFLASADLIDYGVRRGWFAPNRGQPFNFRKVYRRDRSDAPDLRRWRGRKLVTGRREPWPPPGPPPLGVKPREKMTVAAVAAILRDTAGPGRTLSSPVTQEGAVFQLRSGRPKEIGCVYWRTSGEPSTGVLLPWYLGITDTPADYYHPAGVKQHLSLQHHFYPPRGTFDHDPKLAWWTLKGLQDLVRADYDNRIQVVRPVWTSFEQRVFRDQPAVEKKALQLWATDRDAARAHLTRYCAELSARARREADGLSRALRGRIPGRSLGMGGGGIAQRCPRNQAIWGVADQRFASVPVRRQPP
jgi:dipeptidase